MGIEERKSLFGCPKCFSQIKYTCDHSVISVMFKSLIYLHFARHGNARGVTLSADTILGVLMMLISHFPPDTHLRDRLCDD